MGKDKSKVFIGGLFAIFCILALSVWAYTSIQVGGNMGAMLPMGIAVVIMVLMIPFLKRRFIDVKNGYPYEDERSKKILTLATARAYTLSLYWMLALMFYTGLGVEEHGMPPLIPRHVAVVGILGMAAFFVLGYIYTNWKGDAQ